MLTSQLFLYFYFKASDLNTKIRTIHWNYNVYLNTILMKLFVIIMTIFKVNMNELL